MRYPQGFNPVGEHAPCTMNTVRTVQAPPFPNRIQKADCGVIGGCRRRLQGGAQLHAEDYRGPLVRQVEFAAMA